eukprot:7730144-Pyramimonas_sp.AAC.1
MVVTRSASNILRRCSDRTTFNTSAAQLGPIGNCKLRPWSTVGHDTSPRCRSRAGAPTSAVVPAVLQLQ